MRTFLSALFVVISTLALSAADATLAADANKKERDVVVPVDTVPFSVQASQIVRLTGEGIAGAAITAQITGPATILAENKIASVKNGKPVIGPGNREFEIKPTGKGVVKVKITSAPPTGAKPTVTSYQFQVK